jgi:HEAT repeat protein
MGEDDFANLAELEEAFERKNLHHFISPLNRSEDLALLLRVHAVCMLEHIGDEGVVQPLCRILREDPSPLTRHEAAFTFGQLGYRFAVRALVRAMLEDASPTVRHESAVALSSIGDYDVLPKLEKAIEDKDEDVSSSALIALEYLSYLKRKREDSDDASRPKIRL